MNTVNSILSKPFINGFLKGFTETLFDQTPDNKKPLLVNQTNKGI